MECVDFKEYIDKLFIYERELTQKEREGDQRALDLAKSTIDYRLAAMNELREQISKERGNYITREIYDKSMESLEKRVQALELFSANIQGRIWMFAFLTTAITSVVVIIINIFSYLLKIK